MSDSYNSHPHNNKLTLDSTNTKKIITRKQIALQEKTFYSGDNYCVMFNRAMENMFKKPGATQPERKKSGKCRLRYRSLHY